MWNEFVGLNLCVDELNLIKIESWGEVRLTLTLGLAKALTLIDETGSKARKKVYRSFATSVKSLLRL